MTKFVKGLSSSPSSSPESSPESSPTASPENSLLRDSSLINPSSSSPPADCEDLPCFYKIPMSTRTAVLYGWIFLLVPLATEITMNIVFLLEDFTEVFTEFGSAAYIVLRFVFSFLQIGGAVLLVKKGLKYCGVYSILASNSTVVIELWLFWQLLMTNKEQMTERTVYGFSLVYNFWYYLQIRRYKGWLARKTEKNKKVVIN